MNKGRISHVVSVEEIGKRLDNLLWERGFFLSRSAAQRAIAGGFVKVNDLVGKPSCRLRQGDVISGQICPPQDLAAVPQELPLNIVYEDQYLLVVNKERGMVVHPAAGAREGTLVNALLYHAPDMEGVGDRIRPGIVHRLDKDTTGLLVIAKDSATHIALATAIQKRQVKRTYLALVYGRPHPAEGIVDAPLGRDKRDRKRMAVRDDGRNALTRYRLCEDFGSISLLEIDLMTGRTHQIRVHMAAIGHPVVGDPLYGRRRIPSEVSHHIRPFIEALGGQALHACRLSFRHPATDREVSFTAPLPDDMNALLQALRSQG